MTFLNASKQLLNFPLISRFNTDVNRSFWFSYLLDELTLSSNSEDHAVGLSTFTVMAGLGGGFGYTLGAIDWDQTFIGNLRTIHY